VLAKNQEWDVMVDLFFYKKIDEAIKQEEEEEEGEGKHHEEKGKKKWDTYGQEGAEGEEGENWTWWGNEKVTMTNEKMSINVRSLHLHCVI